ncbi:MAG: T9SS type A sorting domain-containing protein [candidate division WOR-3 bacterium]
MKRLLLLLPIVLCAQVIDTVIHFTDAPAQLLYIPDGNKLYINFPHSYRFLVLECSTFAIRKVVPYPADYPTAVQGVYNWRKSKIYYGFNICPESIAVIDNRTDSIIKWIDFDAFQPFSLCYHSRDNKLYATDGISVAVIDCETDSIIKIINQPYYLSDFVLWDSIGNKVYCGSAWTDKVTVIDCERDTVIKVISTGVSTPAGAVYNPFRRKVYVGGYWGMRGAVIDAKNDTLMKNFPMYWEDDIPLIFNSLEDKVYWPSIDSLYVMDCANDSIIKELFVGGLLDMCLASWSNRLYLATMDHDSISRFTTIYVLDCHTDSIISKISFGRWGALIISDYLNQRIYAAEWRDSALYVIRDEIPGVKEECPLPTNYCRPLEIYPNPAKFVMRVRCPWPLKQVQGDNLALKIFDVSGKLIKEIATPLVRNDNEVKISLKGINPGIYFLRFANQTKKFLVVK